MARTNHGREFVTVEQIRPGLRVAMVLGGDEIPEIERTTSDGVVREVREHHPGVVSDCSMRDHVLVAWEGLETAGISTAIGFGANEAGIYPGLVHPAER